MSASQCIKCERIVGGYEKYCEECIKQYGVKEDETFHQYFRFLNWERDRQLEFTKDMAAAAAARNSLKPSVEVTGVLPLLRVRKSTKNRVPEYRKRFGSKPKNKIRVKS
jgi:hypothetical protein